MSRLLVFFFFFQAEDGIRDHCVTGVQTCALPISAARIEARRPGAVERAAPGGTTHISVLDARGNAASLSSSTGSGSGVIVPGTGIHLNNMLGEYDLVGRT